MSLRLSDEVYVAYVIIYMYVHVFVCVLSHGVNNMWLVVTCAQNKMNFTCCGLRVLASFLASFSGTHFHSHCVQKANKYRRLTSR